MLGSYNPHREDIHELPRRRRSHSSRQNGFFSFLKPLVTSIALFSIAYIVGDARNDVDPVAARIVNVPVAMYGKDTFMAGGDYWHYNLVLTLEDGSTNLLRMRRDGTYYHIKSYGPHP